LFDTVRIWEFSPMWTDFDQCHNLSKRNVKLILKILSDLEPLRGASNKKMYSTRSYINWAFFGIRATMLCHRYGYLVSRETFSLKKPELPKFIKMTKMMMQLYLRNISGKKSGTSTSLSWLLMWNNLYLILTLFWIDWRH
jgi:hypothetical protein